jgi:hypothetical protein
MIEKPGRLTIPGERAGVFTILLCMVAFEGSFGLQALE